MSKKENKKNRLDWFKKARFGMFIHWGVYSAIGKGEWYLRNSEIDLDEYMSHANSLKINNDTIENWVITAKKAGMRYVVITTKHHDGFCLFKTKTTGFNSVNLGLKRDLIAEFVKACRKHGMRIGFYFSLIDWSQTKFVREKEENFQLFLDNTVKAQIKELVSNYGTIDIWWYDGTLPGSAKRCQSQALNNMIRKHQPDIIINNRNSLPGDFDTPEQHLDASSRMWESCMTLNDSWGYRKFDNNWKSPNEIIRNLVICSHYEGNFLLNIGPDANGMIPATCLKHLDEIGKVLKKNTAAFFDTEGRSNFGEEPGRFETLKDNKIYIHKLAHLWSGKELRIGGIKSTIEKVYFLVSGNNIEFKQENNIIILENLPEEPPEKYDVVIVLEHTGKAESMHHTHNWNDV